jgi:uncharacterized protein
MKELVTIKGKEVKHGEKTMINLLIDTLPTHTKLELPVYVYRGKEAGPSVLLTAGIHGDEINGIETIRRLVVDKSVTLLRGTVIAVPIVNIYGFLNQTRDMPDGKDLNRSFPGSNRGSLAQRIANLLTEEILPEIDFGIDFHTGAINRPNVPQIRCVTSIKQNQELAKAFAAPFVVNTNFVEKSFRKVAHRFDKNIILYEGGMAQAFDQGAIQEAFDGTLRVLKHFGMIAKAPKPNKSKWLNESTWIRAKHAGLLHPLISLGDKINKNQVIAIITDPFGESEFLIKSHVNGYLIGINNKSVINAGDALFHVGIL